MVSFSGLFGDNARKTLMMTGRVITYW